MDFTTFKILTEGYMAQSRYFSELRTAINDITDKHQGDSSFVGIPFDDTPAMSAILDAIKQFDRQEDFAYFFYECNADYNKFNEAISWEEGDKKMCPDVHSLEDLWRFILYNNGSENAVADAPVKVVGKKS